MASLSSATAESVPPYPTKCLRFLNNLQIGDSPTRADGNSEQINSFAAEAAVEKAKVPLKVIVVGAGLGGLAASIALARRGHEVTVLEQATQLGEVGAGIQIPPNSNRILLEWGLGLFLEGKVVEPAGITFRRWENGNAIGYTKLVPEFRQNFDAPYHVVHRAHLHDALYQLAIHTGVDVVVASKVISYDAAAATVAVENGRYYTGDLIVAADGLKSLARRAVLEGCEKDVILTGFAAYRATVDVEKMKDDPDTSWLVENPALNIWIGEDRHVMTYTIAGGKSFNMVLSHVDRSDPTTWKQDTVLQDMQETFVGWDPCLTKTIRMIDKALKWPLMSGVPLKRWIAPSGKLLIMGDAAHAMVPYMSQGAAMAVEDGAGLAQALSLIENREQIPAALAIFEQVRKTRTSQMQEASLLNGKIWHFPDGPKQQARDAAMVPEVEGRHFIESPNQWSDPVTQWWAYGYSAEAEIVKAWKNRNC